MSRAIAARGYFSIDSWKILCYNRYTLRERKDTYNGDSVNVDILMYNLPEEEIEGFNV